METTPQHSALSSNYSVAALQLAATLLWNHRRWRQIVHSVDPNLSSDCTLVDLLQAGVNGATWRLLTIGFVLLPALTIGATATVFFLLDEFGPSFALAVGLTLVLGVVAAAVINLATGIGVVGLSVVGVLIALRGADMYTADLIVSERLGLLFGTVSAFVVHAASVVSFDDNYRTSLRRQAGGVILGLALSALIAAILSGAILFFILGRQSDALDGREIVLLAGGLAGLWLGLSTWIRVRRWRLSLLVGLLFGTLLVLLIRDIAQEYDRQIGGNQLLRAMLSIGVWNYLIFTCLSFALVRRLASPRAAAIGGVIGGLAVFPTLWAVVNTFNWQSNVMIASLLILVGASAVRWLPIVLYPFELAWNALLFHYDQATFTPTKPWLWRHSVFWDDLQRLPLVGLDEYLVLAASQFPEDGERAFNIVFASHQRWAAQAAQIEIDARRLESCRSVGEIMEVRHGLTAGMEVGAEAAVLTLFARISEDVRAAGQQSSLYSQRLMLSATAERCTELALDLARSNVAWAPRFRPIAQAWSFVLSAAAEEMAQRSAAVHEIPNPYVVGVPLTHQQEIFVGRTDISRRIEGLLRSQNHPPLLLYGQRRMGKTSLLYQLRWMLPQRIVPLVIDLQGPVSLSADHAAFLYNLAKSIGRSAREQGHIVRSLAREELVSDPFTTFDDWLDDVEVDLGCRDGNTVLLALDEFESLDWAIRKERLDEEAILGTLRHLIQHRSSFNLLLAGSHTFGEFKRWSSHLINTETIHLSFLDIASARRLIEQPISSFELSYTEEAVASVLSLTNRHPYLLQLLCSELVHYKNQQALARRRTATAEDVDAVIPETLQRGQQFFADIEQNQVDSIERTVLAQIAACELPNICTRHHLLSTVTSDPIQLESVLDNLKLRELIVEYDGSFVVQVELIRRWFL